MPTHAVSRNYVVTQSRNRDGAQFSQRTAGAQSGRSTWESSRKGSIGTKQFEDRDTLGTTRHITTRGNTITVSFNVVAKTHRSIALQCELGIGWAIRIAGAFACIGCCSCSPFAEIGGFVARTTRTIRILGTLYAGKLTVDFSTCRVRVDAGAADVDFAGLGGDIAKLPSRNIAIFIGETLHAF